MTSSAVFAVGFGSKLAAFRTLFAKSIRVKVQALVELKLLFWQLKASCVAMVNGRDLLKRVGFVWSFEKPEMFRRGASQNKVPFELSLLCSFEPNLYWDFRVQELT